MNAYKKFYNENSGKIDYVKFYVANEYDFSNDPKTNLWGTDSGHCVDEESFFKSLDDDNHELAQGRLMVVRCKDCGRYFLIDDREKAWFEYRDLSLPKRCPDCRRKRKAGKSND